VWGQEVSWPRENKFAGVSLPVAVAVLARTSWRGCGLVIFWITNIILELPNDKMSMKPAELTRKEDPIDSTGLYGRTMIFSDLDESLETKEDSKNYYS
jgi:hypothetical protein